MKMSRINITMKTRVKMMATHGDNNNLESDEAEDNWDDDGHNEEGRGNEDNTDYYEDYGQDDNNEDRGKTRKI